MLWLEYYSKKNIKYGSNTLIYCRSSLLKATADITWWKIKNVHCSIEQHLLLVHLGTV